MGLRYSNEKVSVHYEGKRYLVYWKWEDVRKRRRLGKRKGKNDEDRKNAASIMIPCFCCVVGNNVLCIAIIGCMMWSFLENNDCNDAFSFFFTFSFLRVIDLQKYLNTEIFEKLFFLKGKHI
jgi:hypothetical protein